MDPGLLEVREDKSSERTPMEHYEAKNTGGIMTHTNSYAIGLDRNPANYTPLTPIGFLERAARVYPDRIAMIHGDWQATWKETYSRCRRLASALSKRGIAKGDTVALMAPN